MTEAATSQRIPDTDARVALIPGLRESFFGCPPFYVANKRRGELYWVPDQHDKFIVGSQRNTFEKVECRCRGTYGG